MALEGNLSAFGLSEILQLIAVQQKTGMLTVSSQDSSAVMFFRNGLIVSTRDRRRKARDPFKEYIARYGVLSRQNLIKISQISTQSKLDLIDVLVSEGFMTEDELRKHYHKQIQETLHDILTWEQCSYKFVSSDDVVAGMKSPCEFNIEGLLMESMRRIDEFPHILAMFPNDHVLITRAEGVQQSKDDEELSENEKTVLAIVSEITSLGDVVARAKMPLFEVYESLKLLKEKGLIKTKDDSAKETPADAPAEGARRAARRARNPVPFLAALAVFAAAASFGVPRFVRGCDGYCAAAAGTVATSAIARNQVEGSLRWMIEAYRAQYGVYPQTLESLQMAGIASPSFMEFAGSFSFRYQLTPGRFTYTLL
jgi:hypothetical protein